MMIWASLVPFSSRKCVLRESFTLRTIVVLESVFLQYKIKTARSHLSQNNSQSKLALVVNCISSWIVCQFSKEAKGCLRTM